MTKLWITRLLVAALLAPMPALAATVDEVVAKHLEARGGSAWAAVQTMRVTGTFAAFSTVAPFTLHRQKDDRYHLDHTMNGKKVIIGHDGELAWWDNEWTEPGPQPIRGADLQTQVREFDFVTPFFDLAGKGHQVKLLGDTEYEGEPAIGIELTRKDGSVETWYLDPKTYLELARLSPGSDFGNPMEQRTVFGDFRKVGGVTMPFWRETQWYTRNTVMKVDKVEFGVTIDPSLFRIPPPTGMGPFQSLAGDWTVAAEDRQRPGGEFTKSERTATIRKELRGALLEERFVADETDVIRTLSYDRHRQVYRVTRIDGRGNFLDLLEGKLDDTSKLVVDNTKSRTTTDVFGMKILYRTTFTNVTTDGFLVEDELSTDDGKTWWVASRATYTRAAAKASP